MDGKLLSEIKFQASELRKSVPNSKEAKAESLLIDSIFFPNSTITITIMTSILLFNSFRP